MFKLIWLLLLSTSLIAAEATRIKAEKGALTAWGTCFAIDKDHILTAYHVIEDKNDIFVEVNNSWIKGTIEKSSKGSDLALIKVKHDLVVLPLDIFQVSILASLKSKEIKELKAEPVVFDVPFTVGGSGLQLLQITR